MEPNKYPIGVIVANMNFIYTIKFKNNEENSMYILNR